MTTMPRSERLHGLDALRGFALLLGVVLHASMSYLPGSEYFWIASDGQASRALAGGFHWIHSFRMTLFFVLAGYFGRLALHRRGVAGFVRDRGMRIVLPLVVLWPPMFASIIALTLWSAWLKHGGAPAAGPMPPLTMRTVPLTHLWFLYLLTLLYAAMLAARALLHRIDRDGRAQALLDRVAGAIGGAWAAPVLAVPAMLALVSLPAWWHWFGIPAPDIGLVPNRAACVAYGVAFLAGWTLHRQPALLSALPRRWAINLGIALIASATCFGLVGSTPPAAPAAGDARTWLYAFAYATAGWAWSLALIGLALRFLDARSPARRYLADASYWIYLVHLPLLLVAQTLAGRVWLPWWIELPAMLAAVLALSLLSYQVLVRGTWIGAWLNGRRASRQPHLRPCPAAS